MYPTHIRIYPHTQTKLNTHANTRKQTQTNANQIKQDAGILAAARGMAVWHRAARFCQSCGSGDMAPSKAGNARKCGACGAGAYPRIDPSVIVLVTSKGGEHALLGRKANWPEGRYSTLAGFCEVGETLEETVVREVFEESGVRVSPPSIRFTSSQTWPFPRSLMVAFHAEAEHSPLGGMCLPDP
ncbi:NUDIX hydrolase domain-like protein [Baffinella frigidus]|nr:NUDIX hydrolase domain-like protein [Cryptophyta sp. CCMP2293]